MISTATPTSSIKGNVHTPAYCKNTRNLPGLGLFPTNRHVDGLQGKENAAMMGVRDQHGAVPAAWLEAMGKEGTLSAE